MTLCPRGLLGMLISKIAGTTTSLQRFPPKNKTFKMAATKHVFANTMALSAPMTMILNVYTYAFKVKESNKTHLKTHSIHLHGENKKTLITSICL